jgi:hypothetical protein
MDWVFHDSFKTVKSANKAGDDIVKLSLAAGVKVTKSGKKSAPFMLYILPLRKRGAKKDE